jgi:hypothetical protein
MKVFNLATKEEVNGLPRVLLLDGHSSHYSEEFLEYAHKNNIILLGYPPHCTHALQGLDIVCFTEMKTCWQRAIVDFEWKVMCNVLKAEFLTVWAPAYLEVCDESTTCAAFKVAGIVPFNPNFITEEQMKPSHATSTCGEFPMPQPSPVNMIINSMRLHPPTRFDLSPSYLASLLTLASSSPPQTPLRRHSWDEMENIDPVLWSPSKKMRTLYVHLGSTSTGSLLLRSPKIKSYDISILAPVIQHVSRSIETPNWTLSTPDNVKEACKTQGQLEAENAKL